MNLNQKRTKIKVEKVINKLIKENKIEIIEAHDWSGISAFVNPNCPLVIRLNGTDTYFCHLENRPVKWKNKFLENRALKKANGIISVSNFTAAVTKKLFHLKTPIEVIPNAIDTHQFETVSETKNSETILYFGTLIRKKGLLELPLIFNEVYKKNNKAKLIVIGRDASDIISGNHSTWAMMQSLFDATALKNVNYIGSVAYDEIKAHVSSASVCVFPTFAEALPISWIEAMALEKAIVASDIGWAAEIIEDSVEGFLVHPKNHNLFADRILELLDNQKLRNQFGIEARKKVEQKFSIDVVAKQSADFYKKNLQ